MLPNLAQDNLYNLSHRIPSRYLDHGLYPMRSSKSEPLWHLALSAINNLVRSAPFVQARRRLGQHHPGDQGHCMRGLAAQRQTAPRTCLA